MTKQEPTKEDAATKQEAYIAAVATILTTLAESDKCAIPSAHFYTVLQTCDAETYTLDVYQQLLRACVRRGWIEVWGGYIITLTEAGRAVAARIVHQGWIEV